jgi:hypothetical protein
MEGKMKHEELNFRMGTFEEEFLGKRLDKDGRLRLKLRSRLYLWRKKRQITNNQNFIDVESEIIRKTMSSMPRIGKHWVDGNQVWNIWVNPNLFMKDDDDFLRLEETHFESTIMPKYIKKDTIGPLMFVSKLFIGEGTLDNIIEELP